MAVEQAIWRETITKEISKAMAASEYSISIAILRRLEQT